MTKDKMELAGVSINSQQRAGRFGDQRQLVRMFLRVGRGAGAGGE